MSTIVRAADAAQFLSLVPQLLGCTPVRSLAVIPFAGSRSLGAMRFDLPHDDDPAALDRVAATFLGHVCRIPDADAAAVVVYTDAPFSDPAPHAPLVRALEQRAHECGLRFTDALCVATDAWGSYLERSEARPLSGIVAPAGARHGGDPVGDQHAGADLPDVAPDDCARVGSALASLEAAVHLVCGGEGSDGPRIDPLALEALCLLDDLPTLFDDALEWDADTLAPHDAAALIWCLSRPALRDIALVGWTGGIEAGDEALDAQLRWEEGEEYPVHLAMRMWGEGERPDPHRLTLALDLARRLAAVAPPSHRAGPLATAAWLAWALGRSTHAESYAARACEAEPEHGLGEIVRSFVLAGHLPDWAFQRR